MSQSRAEAFVSGALCYCPDVTHVHHGWTHANVISRTKLKNWSILAWFFLKKRKSTSKTSDFYKIFVWILGHFVFPGTKFNVSLLLTGQCLLPPSDGAGSAFTMFPWWRVNETLGIGGRLFFPPLYYERTFSHNIKEIWRTETSDGTPGSRMAHKGYKKRYILFFPMASCRETDQQKTCFTELL